MTDEPKPACFCSFCGVSNLDTDTLIAGPHVYICDDCVRLCSQILIKVRSEKAAKAEMEKMLGPIARPLGVTEAKKVDDPAVQEYLRRMGA